MRRAPSPAITPQMYRHFAVVTVILTAAVGFFASGENEQAAAAQAPAIRQTAQARPVEAAKAHFKQPSDWRASGDSGTWGSDGNDGFGRPTAEVASFDSARIPLAPSERFDPKRRADSEDDDSDDDTAKAAPATLGPTAAQIAAAAAASRLRSGSAGRN